jgi:hypothetical protein
MTPPRAESVRDPAAYASAGVVSTMQEYMCREYMI